MKTTARSYSRGIGPTRRRGLAGTRLYALVAVAIAAIIVVPAVVLYQGSSNGGSSSSSTSLSEGQQQVASRVNEYAKYIGSLNLSSMNGLYSNGAVLTWYGQGINSSAPFNGAGTYSGGNISALYSKLFNDLVPAGGIEHPIAVSDVLTIAYVSGMSTTPISANSVNASFSLYLNFTSGLFGDVSASIHVQQQWTSQSGSGGGAGGWLLSRDSWNFAKSSVQYPVG